MRTIETTANISAGGELSLRLPVDVTPGRHRIVVVIDPLPETSNKTKKTVKPLVDKDYFESKSLEEILRVQKVKPFKRGEKNNALSDPKLWDGFDEWLADQRKERVGKAHTSKKRGS